MNRKSIVTMHSNSVVRVVLPRANPELSCEVCGGEIRHSYLNAKEVDSKNSHWQRWRPDGDIHYTCKDHPRFEVLIVGQDGLRHIIFRQPHFKME